MLLIAGLMLAKQPNGNHLPSIKSCLITHRNGQRYNLAAFLVFLGDPPNPSCLPVFLVLGNFTSRKGYSFQERATRCGWLSRLAALPWVTPRHSGIRGCALGHVTQNRQIFTPANLLPDVARMCVSGTASLGGDEKRVMHRSDMLNFPQRWCSHNNIFPADGIHVSLPFHWSSLTHWDAVRACVHLLFPEPSLLFWGE